MLFAFQPLPSSYFYPFSPSCLSPKDPSKVSIPLSYLRLLSLDPGAAGWAWVFSSVTGLVLCSPPVLCRTWELPCYLETGVCTYMSVQSPLVTIILACCPVHAGTYLCLARPTLLRRPPWPYHHSQVRKRQTTESPACLLCHLRA